MATIAMIYKPGQTAPESGIYKVTHDTNHTAEHEVTVIEGERFPPCNHCGDHPRFVLVKGAKHISKHKDFSKSSFIFKPK